MSNENIYQSIAGCLAGGAIGDCLGGPFENQQREKPVSSYSWSLSDDSQLTLATSESLIKKKGVDPAHIAQTMADWFKRGRITKVGAATLKSLVELNSGGHWALVGRKGEFAAGNGAAIRMAPLAFFCNCETTIGRRLVRDIARITHHHEEAYIGALAIVLAIQASFKKDLRLSALCSKLPDSRVRDRIIQLSSVYKNTSLPEIANEFGNSGYVVDSVPLAIITAKKILNTSNFKECLISVTHAGGDSDSIASMAGQISGTALGLDNISSELLSKLPKKSYILRMSRDLSLFQKKHPNFS